MRSLIFSFSVALLIPAVAGAWPAVTTAGDCSAENFSIRYLGVMAESEGFSFEGLEVKRGEQLVGAKVTKKGVGEGKRSGTGGYDYPNLFTIELADGTRLGVKLESALGVNGLARGTVYVREKGARREAPKSIRCSFTQDDAKVEAARRRMPSGELVDLSPEGSLPIPGPSTPADFPSAEEIGGSSAL